MMSRTAPVDLPPPPQIKSNTGLRGIAALLVIAYHLQFAGYAVSFKPAKDLIDHGYLMVDLFFILSGFILTYVNGRKSSVKFADYKSFMVSRFNRIYPLHIFCLFYLVVLMGSADGLLHLLGYKSAFGDWSLESLKLLLAQVTLTNGWFFTESGWNTPTWSISVEILAYAIFPFLAVSLIRFRAATVALLLLSAAFYAVIATRSGSLDIIGRVAILRCLAGFTLGMIVCDWRLSVKAIPDRILSVMQVAVIAGIAFVLQAGINDCLIVPLFCLLVYITSDDRGGASNLIARPVFQFLGRISYSIYLNHVCLLIIIIPIWSRIAVAINRHFYFDHLWFIPIFLAAVILISMVTYRYIEVPVGRLLNSWSKARNLRRLSVAPSAP